MGDNLARKPSRAVRLPKGYPDISLQFNCLIAYYWLVLNIVNYAPYAGSPPPTLLRSLLLAPIILFIAGAAPYWLTGRYSRHITLMLWYCVPVACIAIARGDAAGGGRVMMFSLPIVIACNAQVDLSCKLVNILLFLSVVTSIVTFYMGINPYGFVPGQTLSNLAQGVWWRVSLFAYLTPPATGAFCFACIVLNLAHKLTKLNWIAISISIYFMVLSGCRTALSAGCLMLVFWLLCKVLPVRKPWHYATVLAGLCLVFVVSIVDAQDLVVGDSQNETINSYLYRSKLSPTSVFGEETGNRTMMWKRLFDVYLESPIIGMGSWRNAPGDLDDIYRNETLLPLMLARDGIPLLWFVLFLVISAADAGAQTRRFRCCVSIAWFVFLMSYGSMFVPYNFVYLLFVGLFTTTIRRGWRISTGEAAALRPAQ